MSAGKAVPPAWAASAVSNLQSSISDVIGFGSALANLQSTCPVRPMP